MTLGWQESDGRQTVRARKIRLSLAEKAIAAKPHLALPHFVLVAEYFSIQDFAAGIAAFERGMTLGQPRPGKLVGYAKALGASGFPEKALTILDAMPLAWQTLAPVLSQRGIALVALGRDKEAQESLELALAADADALSAATALVRLLTSQQQWEKLLELAQRYRSRTRVPAAILMAEIRGLVGTGRLSEASALVSPDELVRNTTIAPPPGYRDLSDFNASIASDLMSLRKIRLAGIPRIKLAGGIQVEDLEIDSSPAMGELIGIFKCEVARYAGEATGLRRDIAERLLQPNAVIHPWALLLGPDDSQDLHYHLNSSIAGVYYVSVPDVLDPANEDGSLVFPGTLGGMQLAAACHVKPIAGKLVLFPGYIPHRTVPTRCEGLRISIAFDVIAADLA